MEVKTVDPVQDDKKVRLPGKRLMARSGSSIYTGVPCPYINSSNEIEMPARGTPVTTQELLYWMESDFVGQFAITMLTEEAFAFWTADDDPNKLDESEYHKPIILGGLNYAIDQGFSLVVYYDESTDLEAPKNPEMPDVRFDVFPPFYDKYGVKKWDLDDQNRPSMFYIAYGEAHGKELKVHASRCTHIIWNKTTPDWRGLGLLVGAKDDIRDYWLWRRVLGERASIRGDPRYIFNKISGGMWTKPEEDSVDDAMGDIKHALVSMVDVKPLGSDLTDGEIVATLDTLREAIAVQIGVNISDFRGAEAGLKLSVDSNNTRLARTLRKRQNWARPFVEEIYNRMKWDFKGFNPPWEIPPDVQDKSALALIDAMENSTDKDIKEMLKGRVLAIYRGVNKEELNELEPKPEPGLGGGFGQPGATGGARDNASPADRARDRNALNRTRQENAAPSR